MARLALNSAAVLTLGALVATASAAGYQCHSDVVLGGVTAAAQKGFNLDDTTFQYCPSQVPVEWPNSVSGSQMTSLRISRAWDVQWDEASREGAWRSLKAYAVASGAKVLLSTPLTCDQGSDEQVWTWSKQLLQLLGPEHITGLAIGNELDLLHLSTREDVTQECIARLWDGGGIWSYFTRVVDEFDSLGFGSVPVTSVFGGLTLKGSNTTLFYEESGKARVNTFLQKATQAYGARYAWTWTIYPFYDLSLTLDPGTVDQCSNSLSVSLCWEPSCYGPQTIAVAREKMTSFTGRADDLLWIGATGWPSAKSESLKSSLRNCSAWYSRTSFQEYYRNFLAWDLSLPDGKHPVDHAFYVTLRDADTYGVSEYFGLIEECDQYECKMSSEGYIAPTTTTVTTTFDWGFPVSDAFRPVLTPCVAVLLFAGSSALRALVF